MTNPRISVILPTHNRAHTIERAVTSVLCQSFSDLELIVVDDASEDGTLDELSRLRDSRLLIVTRDKRGGGSAARNSGIALARADLIAFQDSDDEWLPTKLQEQVDAIDASDKNHGACYCDFIRLSKEGAWLSECVFRDERVKADITPLLLRQNFISTQTLLVRATLLRDIGGFDEALPRYQDWDLALRVAEKTLFAYVPRPLAILHDTIGSISSYPRNDITARLAILRKFDHLFAQHMRITAHHYLVMSKIARSLGDKATARQMAALALNRDPANWRNWAALAHAHLHMVSAEAKNA